MQPIPIPQFLGKKDGRTSNEIQIRVGNSQMRILTVISGTLEEGPMKTLVVYVFPEESFRQLFNGGQMESLH